MCSRLVGGLAGRRRCVSRGVVWGILHGPDERRLLLHLHSGQLFRLYKKHDFDSESTLKAVEDNLTWRYKNLLDLKPLTAPCRFLRFLPHPLITSSTSKESCPPILYLSLKELSAYARVGTPAEKVEQVKSLMMNVFELARMYLKELDMILESRIGSAKGKEKEDPERLRIFQFALMVDVQGAGMLPTGVGRMRCLPSSWQVLTLFLMHRDPTLLHGLTTNFPLATQACAAVVSPYGPAPPHAHSPRS